MLRRLWRALLGPPYAPPPRFRELVEQLDALEGSVNGLRKRVKVLEGQISGGERSNPGREGAQDAPGPTNGDQLDLHQPPPIKATSELSRRFRRF